MENLTFENETPPHGFDLSAEASRQDEAAATGIMDRSVVLELDDDDDALEIEGQSGDADDDRANDDGDGEPIDPDV